jgi:23S rRNA pseudouridine2605 synthase/23S rRNA pseudouridine2604 synthase
MPTLRLQKFLSQAGICSRRKGEAHILAGRVQVNGQVVTQLGTSVNPTVDTVLFDGRPVALEENKIYIAMHKPRGYVTSCDQKNVKLVVDLIDLPERVYPVGRLDKDSSGLLLLTNDGNLHHRLSHPSFDHEKEYQVTLAAPIADDALKRMSKGIVLDGRKTRRADIRRLSARKFRIVLKEGRNRQIRRMVSKVGHRVHRLKRIRLTNIHLGSLVPGEWRHLSAQERSYLLQSIQSRSPKGQRHPS